MTLQARAFNTESDYDFVRIGGIPYSGFIGPMNVQVSAGTILTWSSDEGVTGPGFVICTTSIPPSPPLRPPSPPTPPLPPAEMLPPSPPSPPPQVPSLCSNDDGEDYCWYNDDGHCDDGGPGAEYEDCVFGTDCDDCGIRILSSPPSPGYPPLPPLPYGALVMEGVPVVRVTYSFPPRNITQEEVDEFMKTVGNVARCATHPVPCQVSRELTATSPRFVRSTVLVSTMTFRLTFPESTFNGSRGSAVPAPAGAARANAVRTLFTSTPLAAPVYSADRTITFTLQLAGDIAAFTESVRGEMASAIATAASVNASLCTETCEWASDGDCDDGGPGTEHSSCAVGTDCTDCGVRELVELNVTSCSVVTCGTATGVVVAVRIRTLTATATTVNSSITNALSSPSLATLMLANVNITGARRARRLAVSVIAIMAMPNVIGGSNMIGVFGITNLPQATITSAAVPYYKPPSPPPAPPPPAAPPGLCSNTCDASGSGGTPGVCNDGASPDPFPFRQLCPFGSDCNDCGSRDFCLTCSLECQRRNNALTDRNRHHGCMESMYGDAVCDPNCNNRECGYDAGRCTQSQIRSVCMAEQDLGRTDYSTRPEALGLLAGARDGSFRFLNSTLSPDTSTRVMGLVPVALSLNFSPIRLVLQQDFNENYIFAEMVYTLQWADPRLARSPCAGALSGMLSLDFEQGLSDIAREAARAMRSKFWVPSLIAGSDAVPGYRGIDESADFSLGTETILIDGAPGSMDEGLRVPILVQPWLDGYGTELPASAPSATPSVVLPIASQFTSGPRNTSTCVGCASWTGDVEFQLLQSHHIYFFYPFDQQELRVTVEVAGAWLYGCVGTGADSPVLAAMGLTEENKDIVLLPPTAEWYLDGPLSETVRVAHPFENGVEKVHRCEVVMLANRNPTVFIFRALVTTIIVVFGSLLTAIFMHAEEHSGDRAAVLYIAFLISLTNMATTNLGLGKVSTLLWYDLFNLSQLLLSLIAVAETMVVHLLFKHNAAKLATHIDAVCRQTLPALYIGVTAGIFIYGFGRGRDLYTSVGFAIMGIFIITMIPATLFFVMVRQGRRGRWQAKCIKELKKADPADGTEYDKRVGQVFHAFDVDESGELDTDELRDLFIALHPKISRDDLSSCIRCMSAYVDPASGVLTEPKFLDALIEGERTLSQRIEERNHGLWPKLRMKIGELGQIQEVPMAIASDEREKVLEEDVIRRHRKIDTPGTDGLPLVTMPQRAVVVTGSSTSTNSFGGEDRSHITQFAKGDKVLYTTKAFGPQIRAEIVLVHTETTPPCYTIRYEGLAIEKQTEEHQLTLALPPPPPPSGSPASALALEASQKLKEQESEQVSDQMQEARRV